MYEFNDYIKKEWLKVTIFPYAPLIKSVYILQVSCPAYTSMTLDFDRNPLIPLNFVEKEMIYYRVILLAFKCVIMIYRSCYINSNLGTLWNVKVIFIFAIMLQLLPHKP
jgi:hypothetical protein